MSFATDTKNELARTETEKKCCMLAEISGFIRVAGSIGLEGFGKFKIIITTDNPAIARHYKKLLKTYFSIETGLEIGEGRTVGGRPDDKKHSYTITINHDNRSEQILRECGILLIREGNNYISDGIYSGIIGSKCCRKSYLRGVFLACGTMSDPEKDYDIEFVLTSKAMANDLKKLIGSFSDLSAKVVQRGNRYVVYMKKADYVSDLLAIMGASDQVLRMADIRINKEVIGHAKRVLNCDNANSDKVVNTSMRQCEAIAKIASGPGINSLPPGLREIAELRLENPNISLAELGELCSVPLSKSGVNNRLKRLEEIARKMQQ